MTEINIKDISALREQTGLGIMEVKKALVESDGDKDKAIEYLRKSGALKAAKKAERTSNSGVVDVYIHANRIGVLVEVSSETDFVAKNAEFKDFVHEIALQIAAANPTYIKKEDVPEEEVNNEKKIFTEQLKKEGKPQNVVEKIIEGKLEKFYGEVCLLEQIYIKDSNVKIKDLLTEKISKIGENIVIKRFARFEVGC